MSSIIQSLDRLGLLSSPPPFVVSGLQYEVTTGSFAYGVAGDDSDSDLYGWCIPPREMVFPHLTGEIPGFGKQIQRFQQFQQQHITNPHTKKEYDISVYGVVRYFQLCMENNPNMVDSLFVPFHCIHHATKVGTLVRDNRRLFLHKGCFHKFRGYAHQQLHKARTKKKHIDDFDKFCETYGLSEQPSREAFEIQMIEQGVPEERRRFGLSLYRENVTGKRREAIKTLGYDSKFLYHVVRLVEECKQILETGNMDLQKNSEYLKAIRRGEVPPSEIEVYFAREEAALHELYNTSTLQYEPDEETLKRLLLNCLEEYYGRLEQLNTNPRLISLLRDISILVNRNQDLLGEQR